MAANVQKLLHILEGSATLMQHIQSTPSAISFGAQQLQTFEQLLEQVPALEFSVAAQLASKISETKLWDEASTNKLLEIISKKAASAVPNVAAGECLNLGRRVLQDYTALAHYLTPSVLNLLSARSTHMAAKAEILGNFASKLGLQCPNEQTFAAMVGILDVASNDFPVTSAERHDRLKHLKPLIKSACDQKAGPDMPYVVTLPSDRSLFMESPWFKSAFIEEKPLEEWAEMAMYIRHWKTVPLRVTNMKVAYQPFQRLQPHSNLLPEQIMQFLQHARMPRPASSSHGIDIQYLAPYEPRALPNIDAPPPPAMAPSTLAIEDKMPPLVNTAEGAAASAPQAQPSPASNSKARSDQRKANPLEVIQRLGELGKEAASERKGQEEEEVEAVEPKAKAKSKASKTEQVYKKPAANTKGKKTQASGKQKRAVKFGLPPNMKARLRERPQGCSKCRWKAGCTPSCFRG
jgi:hypothetical protein